MDAPSSLPLHTFLPNGGSDRLGLAAWLLFAGCLSYFAFTALLRWETPLGAAIILALVAGATWGLLAGRARRIEIYRDRLVLVHAGTTRSIPFETIEEARIIGRRWIRWKFARPKEYFGSAQAKMLQLETYGGSSALVKHYTPYVVISAADHDAFIAALEAAMAKYAASKAQT